ncbi:MAG: glycosyltransferase family 4 protein [Bacteroidota bacterium]
MTQKPRHILFAYLNAFSQMGGIQQYNKAFMQAGHTVMGVDFHATSVKDHQADVDCRYIPSEQVDCFAGNKLRFLLSTLNRARRTDILVLGHINLALLGVLIKLLFPNKAIWLVVHGIEVWHGNLSRVQQVLLGKADRILSVSEFTKNTVVMQHDISPEVFTIFPNTLDPYFSLPRALQKPAYLLEKYGISPQQPVVFSLARLSTTEKFKGYDNVLKALSILKKEKRKMVYLLGGKAQPEERERIEGLVQEYDLEGQVILTGFIAEQEIQAHFLLADVFVLPSKKEGFGIVFIEALACGLQVIAGNKDGSVEALVGGELGTLVNPDDIQEIGKAIRENIGVPLSPNHKQVLQSEVVAHFGFEQYVERWKRLLEAPGAVQASPPVIPVGN